MKITTNQIILFLILGLGISLYFNFQNMTGGKDTFANNLKCSQFIEKKNKEISGLQDLPINRDRMVSAPVIFYSPKLDTCVSAFSILHFDEVGRSIYFIEDLLTNNSIRMISGLTDDPTTYEKYENKIEELKGYK